MIRFTVMMVMAAFLLITGCAPYFGNAKQYEAEEWYGFGTAGEVKRLKDGKLDTRSRELALKKLESQPVQTKVENGVQQGYRGKVFNADPKRIVTIQIVGPETKSYTLTPLSGEDNEYLLPGDYIATTFIRGKKHSDWKFAVGVPQYRFMGQQVHWGIVFEP